MQKNINTSYTKKNPSYAKKINPSHTKPILNMQRNKFFETVFIKLTKAKLTWKGTCNNCDKAVKSFFWK